MRRVLALLLLAPIGSPLITPLLLAYSRSDLPTCCRRDGKHHCAGAARTDEAPVKAPALQNLQPKCSVFPGPGAVPANSKIAIVAIRSKVAPADHLELRMQPRSCSPVRTVVPGAERKRGPPLVFS